MVAIHARHAYRGILAGLNQSVLSFTFAFDNLFQSHIFDAGKEEVALLAVQLVDHLGQGVAVLLADRLGPQISRFKNMRICGYDHPHKLNLSLPVNAKLNLEIQSSFQPKRIQ